MGKGFGDDILHTAGQKFDELRGRIKQLEAGIDKAVEKIEHIRYRYCNSGSLRSELGKIIEELKALENK